MTSRVEPVPVPRPPRSRRGLTEASHRRAWRRRHPTGRAGRIIPGRDESAYARPVSLSRAADHPGLARRLVDALPAATLVIDAVGTVLSASRTAAEAVELEPDDLVG